jgi:hypothetical protein
MLGAGLISSFGRILPIIGLLFVIVAIISALRSFSSGDKIPIVKRQAPSYDTLGTSRKIIEPTLDSSGKIKSGPDTLISHFIRWKDYDSISYQIILSVFTSQVQEARLLHAGVDNNGLTSLRPVYDYLELSDTGRLNLVYSAFSEIKQKRALNELQFAQMVVSCIQSIPYYLVLDGSCSLNENYDEFIYNYLSQCNRDCCIGDEKFGVRSPAEFIADLKGDCDTRSLLLYSILKKFHYNVALLSSEYYKHAIIAVNFSTTTDVSGLSMNIHDKNFYLWETTSFGFHPGEIPAENRNLNYWNIDLLNEIN